MTAFWFQMYGRLSNFELGNPPHVHVSRPDQFHFLCRPDPEVRDDLDRPMPLALVYVAREVPDTVADVLLGNWQRTRNPSDVSAHPGSEDGLGGFPEGYRTFARGLASDLREILDNTMGILLWRAGTFGGPFSVGGSSFDIRWQPVAEPVNVTDKVYLQNHLPHSGFTWRLPGLLLASMEDDKRRLLPYATPPSPLLEYDRFRDGVQALVDDDFRQPLYHDLLREAFENSHSSPRSSLIIAVAAIETGVKTLVTDLQPDTRWLLENLASPSVIRMLRELVQTLPARCTFAGKVHRPSKAAITIVQKAIERRNKLVHGVSESVPGELLDEILVTFRQLLYLFDFYRGQEWAQGFLTSRVLDAVAP